MPYRKSPARANGRSRGEMFWTGAAVGLGEVSTPLGPVRVVVVPGGVLRIDLPHLRDVDPLSPRRLGEFHGLPVKSKDPRVEAVKAQLKDYFAGDRREFELPLALVGTEFDRRVWAVVARTPFGRVTTYAAVARAIGVPAAFRAVGAANGRNPVPIVRPCHRVVGEGGRLTGYGGGVELKARLLALEGVGLTGTPTAPACAVSEFEQRTWRT